MLKKMDNVDHYKWDESGKTYKYRVEEWYKDGKKEYILFVEGKKKGVLDGQGVALESPPEELLILLESIGENNG